MAGLLSFLLPGADALFGTEALAYAYGCDAGATTPHKVKIVDQAGLYLIVGSGGVFCDNDSNAVTAEATLMIEGIAPSGHMSWTEANSGSAVAQAQTACPAGDFKWQTIGTGSGHRTPADHAVASPAFSSMSPTLPCPIMVEEEDDPTP